MSPRDAESDEPPTLPDAGPADSVHPERDSAADEQASVDPVAGSAETQDGDQSTGASEADLEPSSQALMPEMIGHYKILGLIASGGMGHVYRARRIGEDNQTSGPDVALKVIASMVPSKRTLARFSLERHALSVMDHPNIARVFDSGVHGDSQPYVVMELVDGTPIDAHCDTHRLSIDDRLQLFLQVCQGIQHAHQKGLIHRDIKPSNLLVTIEDGRRVAKVIDFGLAKAVDEAERSQSMSRTQAGDMVGTIEYMSPEQALAIKTDVDTRTDVYSLGVILHQLLTGQSPMGRARSLTDNLESLLRTLREEDVKLPSRLISQSGDQGYRFAYVRKTTPDRLARRLAGDLDLICLKALERFPHRRYDTPSALADDITRYLNGEPVSASPRSYGYQMRHALLRHRTFVTATSAVVLALVIGLIATAVMWSRSESQRARATLAERFVREAAQEADRNSKIAQRERDAAVAASENARSMAAQTNYLLAEGRRGDGRIREAFELLQQIPSPMRRFEWFLSQSALETDKQSFNHPCNENVSVQFDPAGQRMLSVGQWGLITTCPVSTQTEPNPQESRVFSPEGLRPACWNPNADRVAAQNRSFDIVLVDANSGRTETTLAGYDEPIVSIDWYETPVVPQPPEPMLPDASQSRRAGSLIAIATRSGKVAVIDVETETRIFELETQSEQVAFVRFSPDGSSLMISVGKVWAKPFEFSLSLWEISSATLKWTAEQNDGPIKSLAFHPGGQMLVTADAEGRLRLLNAENGRLIRSYEKLQSPGVVVCFSDSGDSIAVGTKNGTIYLYDPDDYRAVCVLTGHVDTVTSLDFHPDQPWLLSGGLDQCVRRWDFGSATRPRPAEFETVAVMDGVVGTIAISPDGALIACAGGNLIRNTERDHSIYLLDAKTKTVIRTLDGHSKAVLALEFIGDGKQLVSGSQDKTAKIWDLETGDLRHNLSEHESWVSSVSVNVDGTVIATGCHDGLVRLWNSKTGERTKSIAVSDGKVRSVVLSKSGNQVLSASTDERIQLWDCETGESLRSIVAGTDRLDAVYFAEDESQVIASGADHELRLWDLKTGRSLRTFAGHTRFVRSMSFHPDAMRLVSCSDDGTIRIWDFETGRELKSILVPEAKAWSVAISSRGDSLYAGLDNGRLAKWSADRSRTTKHLDLHTDQITTASFCGTGRYVVTAGEDLRLALWCGKTGRLIAKTRTIDSPISSAVISHNGKWIIAGSQAGTLFWLRIPESKTLGDDEDVGDLIVRHEVSARRGPIVAIRPNQSGDRVTVKTQRGLLLEIGTDAKGFTRKVAADCYGDWFEFGGRSESPTHRLLVLQKSAYLIPTD